MAGKTKQTITFPRRASLPSYVTVSATTIISKATIRVFNWYLYAYILQSMRYFGINCCSSRHLGTSPFYDEQAESRYREQCTWVSFSDWNLGSNPWMQIKSTTQHGWMDHLIDGAKTIRSHLGEVLHTWYSYVSLSSKFFGPRSFDWLSFSDYNGSTFNNGSPLIILNRVAVAGAAIEQHHTQKIDGI